MPTTTYPGGNTVNNLITTTISDWHKDFADNVSNSNALLALLKQGNRHRSVEGGKDIFTPLTYAEETMTWYSSNELLSRSLKETLSGATYLPANAAVSVTLDGPTIAKNSGRAAILNILEGKMENAQVTMNNNIAKCIYGDGSLAKTFPGLLAMVTRDGNGTVGSITAGASEWAFWMNQFQSVARATGLQYPALKAAMNALWLKLIRGTEHPDLIVADGEIYGTYESGLQENQRYADARMGALGFEALKYKQASMVYDAPATGLGPGSDATKSGAYYLNTKYFKFETYSGRNFEALDLPDQSPDMDAVTKHIAFMGCLTCSNRALQGRLFCTGS
jgi:hypothetical protein